jgi:hypothetical protein
LMSRLQLDLRSRRGQRAVIASEPWIAPDRRIGA